MATELPSAWNSDAWRLGGRRAGDLEARWANLGSVWSFSTCPGLAASGSPMREVGALLAARCRVGSLGCAVVCVW